MNAAAERMSYPESPLAVESRSEIRNGEVIEFTTRERAAQWDQLMAQLIVENAQLREELMAARRRLEQMDVLIRNTRIREFEIRAAILRMVR